jgi:hypothetical protein
MFSKRNLLPENECISELEGKFGIDVLSSWKLLFPNREFLSEWIIRLVPAGKNSRAPSIRMVRMEKHLQLCSQPMKKQHKV